MDIPTKWVLQNGTGNVVNDTSVCTQTETEELLRYKQKPIRIPQKLVKQISLFVRKNHYFLYLPHSQQFLISTHLIQTKDPRIAPGSSGLQTSLLLLVSGCSSNPPKEIAIEGSNFPNKLFFLPIEQ